MDIINEIKRGLKQPGKSKVGLAKAMGVQPSAVTAILTAGKNGKPRQIKVHELPKIKAYFDLDLDDSHIESGDILPTEDRPAGRTVKIKGYVGAGDKAHYYAVSDEDYAEVEAPEGSSNKTVAVEIRGKSFGPLLDTWLVFYDDVRSPVTPDLYGEICVVGLDDDRILIKQIKPAKNGRFTLLSNANEPPIENAKIEWAARVIGMRAR